VNVPSQGARLKWEENEEVWTVLSFDDTIIVDDWEFVSVFQVTLTFSKQETISSWVPEWRVDGELLADQQNISGIRKVGSKQEGVLPNVTYTLSFEITSRIAEGARVELILVGHDGQDNTTEKTFHVAHSTVYLSRCMLETPQLSLAAPGQNADNISKRQLSSQGTTPIASFIMTEQAPPPALPAPPPITIEGRTYSTYSGHDMYCRSHTFESGGTIIHMYGLDRNAPSWTRATSFQLGTGMHMEFGDGACPLTMNRQCDLVYLFFYQDVLRARVYLCSGREWVQQGVDLVVDEITEADAQGAVVHINDHGSSIMLVAPKLGLVRMYCMNYKSLTFEETQRLRYIPSIGISISEDFSRVALAPGKSKLQLLSSGWKNVFECSVEMDMDLDNPIISLSRDGSILTIHNQGSMSLVYRVCQKMPMKHITLREIKPISISTSDLDSRSIH
jgi:hypothetical protein